MPLVADSKLPAFARLAGEGCDVVDTGGRHRAQENLLHIGLLNLMPDAALQATERQFLRLLSLAAGGLFIYVRLFTATKMPRGARAREHVATYYRDFSAIKEQGLDALILSGANPANPELSAEPFWDELLEVFDWSRHQVPSTMCSCLATHAVVKQYHGIERIKLPRKRWGVYSHRLQNRDHALLRHVNTRFHAPHSHVYEVTSGQLEGAGLVVLAESEEAGVHLAVSEDGQRLVYFQGHPEYDISSILKEYKREVSRFAQDVRTEYPPFPDHYFNAASVDILSHYRERMLTTNDKSKLLTEFPEARLAADLDNTWIDTGKAMFSNWLRMTQDIVRNS